MAKRQNVRTVSTSAQTTSRLEAIAIRSKDATNGAPGLTTGSKDATRSKGHRYERSKDASRLEAMAQLNIHLSRLCFGWLGLCLCGLHACGRRHQTPSGLGQKCWSLAVLLLDGLTNYIRPFFPLIVSTSNGLQPSDGLQPNSNGLPRKDSSAVDIYGHIMSHQVQATLSLGNSFFGPS